MFKQISRVGIVGAGISSLTLAINLCKSKRSANQKFAVTIFEENSEPGGRIKTKSVLDKNKLENYFLDVGANLIDFQNQASLNDWNQLLPNAISKNLTPFSRPFLLHENNKFRKGDYEKERYYYNGGFYQLIEDLIKFLEKDKVKLNYNHKITQISIEDAQVKLSIQDKLKNLHFKQKFDKVYLGCPPPAASKLFQSHFPSNKLVLHEIMDFCDRVKYTKQISVAFSTVKNVEHQFSCILFIKHSILSFICSHREKYKQYTFVTQTTEQFSQNNFNESDDRIAELVYNSLPQDLKNITNKDYLLVHRWPISLVKPQKNASCPPLNECIEFIGDSIMGKSRVSGAVQSIKKIVSKL